MPPSRWRCAGVWAGVTAAATALLDWLAPLLTDLPGPHPAFDDLLVRTCAAAAAIAAAWLWALTSAVVVEALRGGRTRVPGVPPVVRRLVLAACGVGLVAGLAGPVHATPGDLHQDRRPGASALAGLPYPDRAVALPGDARLAVGARAESRHPEVVVGPGDTLWAIAERRLGGGERWGEIYALNRDRVGADPDLIRPAQRLRLPFR